MRRQRRTLGGTAIAAAALILASLRGVPAGAADPAFVISDLEAKGEIHAVRIADLDGDGRKDVLVVVQTQRTEERSRTTERDGQFVLDVVSVLVRERQARGWLQDPAGRFPGPPSTLALDPEARGLDVADVDGDGRSELLLLMPDGIDALRVGAESERLRLLSCRSIYSETAGVMEDLRLAHDLDGDGRPELLIPTFGELLVYWGNAQGVSTDPLRLPGPSLGRSVVEGSLSFAEALPLLSDATGDGLQDVTFLLPWGEVICWVQKRRGVFVKQPIRAQLRLKGPGFVRHPVGVADVTGDGHLDVVTWSEKRDAPEDEGGGGDGEDGDARQGGAHSIEVFAGTPELGISLEPGPVLDLGTPAKGESLSFCQLRDLDGDHRPELLPVFMKVGTMQLVRALLTKAITVSLRVPVVRMDGGKLRIASTVEDEMDVSLKRLSASYLLSFEADVDGDGLKDLVRPGGKGLKIARGRAGGLFDRKASTEVPAGDGDGLVGGLLVEDLDGDGRDDLVIVRESWKKDRLQIRVAMSARKPGTLP